LRFASGLFGTCVVSKPGVAVAPSSRCCHPGSFRFRVSGLQGFAPRAQSQRDFVLLRSLYFPLATRRNSELPDSTTPTITLRLLLFEV